MTLTVKQPFIWSTSEYNSPTVQVRESEIPVAAALCRASLGTPAWMGSIKRATDQVFPIYWCQWDTVHLPRCAYHFLMNGAGGRAQADHFYKCVQDAGGFHVCDRIGLDVEDLNGGYSMREIVDFLWNIHILVPYIPFRHYLLYSRRNILNPLSFSGLTLGECAMLLSIWQWPAGYPDEPDLWDFAHLARGYRFDTARFGPVALVQYAGSAVINGLSKPDYLSIECNVADPAYLAEWEADTSGFYAGDNPMTPKYKCTVTWDKGASIRVAPTTGDANPNPVYPDNAVFLASALVPDQDDPTNPEKQWATIESDPVNGTQYAGRYVAVKYPSSTAGVFIRATVEDLSAPPPPTGMSVTLAVKREDGTVLTPKSINPDGSVLLG